MDFVNLVLNSAILIGIIRIGMALSEMKELYRLAMFESDLPEDLKRYIDREKGY